jgi:hypothetical protein
MRHLVSNTYNLNSHTLSMTPSIVPMAIERICEKGRRYVSESRRNDLAARPIDAFHILAPARIAAVNADRVIARTLAIRSVGTRLQAASSHVTPAIRRWTWVAVMGTRPGFVSNFNLSRLPAFQTSSPSDPRALFKTLPRRHIQHIRRRTHFSLSGRELHRGHACR